MNAPTTRWDWHSAVSECTCCEGKGEVCITPFHTHPNDPDRCDRECPECDGVGHHACKVCGFDIVVPGYDCIVCLTANEFPWNTTTAETAAHFAECLAKAFAARNAAVAQQVAE